MSVGCRRVSTEQLLTESRLQRGKREVAFWIAIGDEEHGLVAEVTIAVEKHDGLVRVRLRLAHTAEYGMAGGIRPLSSRGFRARHRENRIDQRVVQIAQACDGLYLVQIDQPFGEHGIVDVNADDATEHQRIARVGLVVR